MDGLCGLIQDLATGNEDVNNNEDDPDEEEEENQEEEPTPSNAEIRQMLHRLQLGLDKKGYGKIDEFKELDADIRVFLRDRQPMRQKVITEFFWVQRDHFCDFIQDSFISFFVLCLFYTMGKENKKMTLIPYTWVVYTAYI